MNTDNYFLCGFSITLLDFIYIYMNMKSLIIISKKNNQLLFQGGDKNLNFIHF